MKAMRDTKLVALIILLIAMVVAGLASVAAGPSTREPSPAFKDTFAVNTPALAVTAWYFDNANVTGCAADTNSCTSATCGVSGVGPCATFNQIATRLGGTQPVYPPGTVVTFNQLSAQTANQDVIFFEPRVSDGGQAILKVALVNGVSFTAGTVTAMTRGAPGNLLTVVFPGGTVPVKNQLIVNNTRSSQAIIDSVSGQTATMQSPLTTASVTNTTSLPSPTEDLTWASGDAMTVYTLLNSNIKHWSPVGADSLAGNVVGGAWIFYASFNDTSGANTSTYGWRQASAWNSIVNCVVNTRLHISVEAGRTSTPYLVGSSVVGQLVAGGAFAMYGGALASGLNQGSGVGQTILEADAIVHGSSNWYTGFFVPDTMYSDGTWTFFTGAADAINFFWGSYTVTLNPGFRYWNGTGSTFALKALLTTGALKIGTSTTASKYQGAGVWVDGIAITPANIDTGGTAGVGLTDPLTGAGFSNGQ
jgi:hypothetical protein